MLINLIKNALKFTPCGFIQILSFYNYIEQELVVHVRDSGKGISDQDLKKLFKRFGKLESKTSSENREGIGLGLAICEAIIQENNG